MGYSSNLVIAIHKTLLAQDLIAPFIPDALKKEESTDIGDARYWALSGWKWYDRFPEVKAIEGCFNAMDAMENVPDGEPLEGGYQPSKMVYGAIRVGEDSDDVQSWGDPSGYDIHLNRFIDSPVSEKL